MQSLAAKLTFDLTSSGEVPVSLYSSLLDQIRPQEMASFKQPQKRRQSSGQNSSRNTRGRALSVATSTRSDTTSGSRYAAPRRSSAGSSRSQASNHATPTPGARFERSASVASSRTFTGISERQAATETPSDGFGLDEDNLSEVIMAVNMLPRGLVGCAYYVARDEKLYFMEDVTMGGPEVIDACVLILLVLYLPADTRQ